MATDTTSRTPMDRLESSLEKLRKGFVERFPDRVDDLISQWAGLLEREWSSSDLRGMHTSVHGMVGTAGSLGLTALAESALEIERLLVNILDDDERPTAQGASEMASLLEQLSGALKIDEKRGPQAVIRDFERLSPPPMFEPRNLIVIVETGGDFAQELAVQLGHFGFELEMFERIDDVRSADGKRRPAAVILDLSTASGIQVGSEAAAGVRETFGSNVPVVFVSNRSDVEARLDAVRAGCSGYFVKPVNFSEIVSALDQITRGEPDAYKILIVDDESDAAALHAATLEAAGMKTVTVVDPMEVMAQLVELQPDVILMDIYMPSCSGKELAAVIRQEEAFVGVPIVFVSRETDRMKQIEALGEGGDDFFTKPIPPDQLVAGVSARAQRGRTLRQFMERDGLTGLYSHGRIVEQLEAAVRRADRHGFQLAVAMLDIDDFKSVNDTYGHLVGDQVLKSLAHLLRQRLRLSDSVGRFGGDEYLVILPDTDGASAQRKMDDIRANFAAIEHDTGRVSFTITLSGGVAGFPEIVTSHQLIASADEALYRAKRAGRNKMFGADPEGKS